MHLASFKKLLQEKLHRNWIVICPALKQVNKEHEPTYVSSLHLAAISDNSQDYQSRVAER